MQDLEQRKAKLRSQYCYQPATSHFNNLLKKYEETKRKAALYEQNSAVL